MTLQGAIQQLYDMRCNDKFPIYYKPAIDEVIKTIVADAQEVRRGRWIRTGEDGYCSVCKCDMPMFRNDWEWEYTETPFCPNCGARMEASE